MVKVLRGIHQPEISSLRLRVQAHPGTRPITCITRPSIARAAGVVTPQSMSASNVLMPDRIRILTGLSWMVDFIFD